VSREIERLIRAVCRSLDADALPWSSKRAGDPTLLSLNVMSSIWFESVRTREYDRRLSGVRPYDRRTILQPDDVNAVSQVFYSDALRLMIYAAVIDQCARAFP
jgi:hypothetical protein